MSPDRHPPARPDPVAAPDGAPPPGTYAHYKGASYRVVDLVRHSETEEWLVLYRPLYGDGGLWVRPLAMFVDTVTVDGRIRPRFQRTGD